MADETSTSPAPETTTTTTTNTPTPAATGGAISFTTEQQAHIDALIKDRLDRQQRAITTQREKERADAEATRLAEQGQFKELAATAQAERDALAAQLAARDHADLQRAIAAEHQLPAEMATRLQGATRDELVVDAKALAKLVAQPAAPPTPGNRPSPRPHSGPDARSVEDDLRASGRYNAI